MFIAHAVCLLARAPKSRMLDHALWLMYEGKREHHEIPDEALDMHTARGARQGRGIQHFLEKGAKLENRSPIPDPYEEEAKQRVLKRRQQHSEPEPVQEGQLFDE